MRICYIFTVSFFIIFLSLNQLSKLVCAAYNFKPIPIKSGTHNKRERHKRAVRILKFANNKEVIFKETRKSLCGSQLKTNFSGFMCIEYLVKYPLLRALLLPEL